MHAESLPLHQMSISNDEMNEDHVTVASLITILLYGYERGNCIGKNVGYKTLTLKNTLVSLDIPFIAVNYYHLWHGNLVIV